MGEWELISGIVGTLMEGVGTPLVRVGTHFGGVGTNFRGVETYMGGRELSWKEWEPMWGVGTCFKNSGN